MKRFTLLLFIIPSLAFGTIFYVSPLGSDTAVGTETAPWKTIQKAFTTAQANDTIQLLSGSFTPAATKHDGPITLIGQADLSAVITGNGGNSTSQAIYITHAYYTVSNLYCNGARILCRGDGAHDNVIEHNTVINAYNGFAQDGGTGGLYNNVVRYNDISHWRSNGALLITGHDSLFSDNTIHDNDGFDAVRAFGYNQTVSHNQFININPDLVSGNHGDVIQTFGNSVTGGTKSYNIIFERNTIKDSAAQWCTLQGYDTTAHPNPDVRDWIIRNNLTYGIGCRMHLDIAIPGTQIYNNTFYHSTGTDTISLGYTVLGSMANNTKIKNNLIVECGSTATNGFYNQPANLIGVEYDYNFVSGQGGTTKTPFREAHGINGGFSASQIFVNTTDDFRLNIGSPAISTGVDLSTTGFNNDLNGVTRNCWNMGAFAYP